jgi:hypothetical protein
MMVTGPANLGLAGYISPFDQLPSLSEESSKISHNHD